MRWLTAQRITAALFATPVAETVLHETWPAHHCLRIMTSGVYVDNPTNPSPVFLLPTPHSPLHHSLLHQHREFNETWPAHHCLRFVISGGYAHNRLSLFLQKSKSPALPLLTKKDKAN